MRSSNLSMVIVGAGQAGARAAKGIRDAQFAGAIHLIGDESYLPYERPDLSKTLLQGPTSPIPFVFKPDFYESMDIVVRTSCKVEAINRAQKSIRLGSGEDMSYDRLLLATGSYTRPFTVPGYPPDKQLALRSLDDCRAIERRLEGHPAVVIIGGGFIGLEVAATLVGRGCRVTVVESASRLLPRLNCPEASQAVLDHHGKIGVDVRLACRVSGGGDRSVQLEDGELLDADLVVVGVGVLPNTRLAEDAGLEVDDGVLVDEFGRTSDPDIFAAGDVTRHFNPLLGRRVRLENWQNANQQGEAVGRNMAGVPTTYAEIPWLWSDQGALDLQMAGAPIDPDTVIVRGACADEEGISVFQFEGNKLTGGMTINRGKEMPIIRRLLAASKLSAPPELLADVSIPLRRFLPSRGANG